ncbi:MAG: amidase family protein, partial [Patescibacteria group bacterium]
PTKNPWNLAYTPGGSCGGSGATLATNLTTFEIGGDTGGSVRCPAAFCSVIGLKVTYGLVSRYGSIAFASSLDTVSPMTRSAEDCALVLETIAGNDPLDATSTQRKIPRYSQTLNESLKGIRLGIPEECFAEGVDQDVKNRVAQAIESLKKLGVKTVAIELPNLKYSIATYYLINTSETSSNLGRYDAVRYGNPRADFGAEAKRRIMLGTFTLSAGYYDAYYRKATKVRTLIRQDFQEAFKKVDLIATPAMASPPFKLGEKNNDPLQMYLTDIFTAPASLAGIPAIAFPCGFNREKLPIGIQIIGPAFSEAKLLSVAHQFEIKTGGFPSVTTWGESND